MMLRLSFMLLKNRKRFLITLISILTVSAIASVFAFTISTSNYNQKEELAFKKYGSFICGICELSAKDREKIKKNSDVKSGHFILYGKAKCTDNSYLTLGYGDNNFREMANVELTEGHMPVKSNEIAIEHFAAKILGVSKTGEAVHLKINGIKKSMTVTGIVGNYSNQLNTYYELKKGINDYPNIFCVQNFYRKSDPITPHYSVLLGFQNNRSIQNNQMATMNKMYQKIDKIGISSGNIYDNDHLFEQGLEFCKQMSCFSILFISLVTVSGGLCMILLCLLFYKDYPKKIAVFVTCGLTKKQTRNLFFIQSSFLIFVSWGISAFIYLVIYFLCTYFYVDFISIISMKSVFLYLCLWYLIIFIGVCFIIQKGKLSFCDNICSHLSGFNDRQTIIGYRKKYAMGTNILKKLSSIQLETVLLNLLIFLCCSVLLYSYMTTSGDYTNIPDYEMHAKDIVETECVNGYEIEYNPDRYIPKDAFHKLLQSDESLFLDTYVHVNSHTLLLTKGQNCKYFEDWMEQNALIETKSEDSIILDNWPSEANNYTPIPNTEIAVLSNQQFKEMSKHYETAQNNLNGVVLFLPGASDKQLKQILGNHIFIGGINLEHSQVKFRKTEIPVNDILFSDYKMEYGGYQQERNSITILMSEKKLEQLDFVQGFQKIAVFDHNQSKKTSDMVHHIMNSIEGGTLYIKQATQSAEERYVAFLHTLNIFLIMLFVFLIGSYLLTNLFRCFISRKNTLGILTALGLSRSKWTHLMFISDLKSALVSIIMGTGILLFLRLIEYLEFLTVHMVILPCSFILVLTFILKILYQKEAQKYTITKLIDKQI